MSRLEKQIEELRSERELHKQLVNGLTAKLRTLTIGYRLNRPMSTEDAPRDGRPVMFVDRIGCVVLLRFNHGTDQWIDPHGQPFDMSSAVFCQVLISANDDTDATTDTSDSD